MQSGEGAPLPAAIPHGATGGSASSLLSTPEGVVWRADQARRLRPSPSRAAPVPPESSASSRVSEHDRGASGVDASALHDTTVLSDLSDEIQRVEARLAAIREEELRLMPQRVVPALPTRESGRFCSVLDLQNVDIAAHRSAASRCRVNPLSDTDAEPTDLAAPSCSNARYTPDADFTHVSKRQYYQSHRVDSPWADVNDPTNTTVSEGRRQVPLASGPATTGSLREPSVEASKAQLELRGAVFSLATFLRPLRVVDIEIASGVYEKLELFAGDEMEEVARSFITKHGLDMQRALRPLHAFLLSLDCGEARNQAQESAAEGGAPPGGGNSAVATAPNNINRAPSCRGSCGGKHGCPTFSSHVSGAGTNNAADEKAARPQGLDPAPRHSPRGVSMGKTRRMAAAHGISQFEKHVAGPTVAQGKSALSGRSQRKTASPPEREQQRNTPVTVPKRLSVIGQKQTNTQLQECSRGDTPSRRSIETGAEALELSVQKRTPPEVKAVEVEAIKPTIRRTNSVPRVRPLNRGSALVVSRHNSTEPRRSLSASRSRKTTPLQEEPMPAFKPSLAPRSRQLAAQDLARRQGPTYARLHAHTPRLSKAHAAAEAECVVKPKILPRQREGLPRETVGQRLYEQAVDQQHRMQEKRIKEHQRKEEEEKRSIIPGPQINKVRGQNKHERESMPANSCGLRTWPPNQRNQTLNVPKSHEERELEACTFAPAVNPASVRMFNLVVRGLALGEEPAEREENSGVQLAGRVSGGGSGAQTNENVPKQFSVEDRLLRHEQNRRKRLEEERLFRATVDVATGQPLFRPFLGR
ncbi:uncharacterized protein Tco025E_06281 [Trypanosoma conorhini]|uniref:Uncharacterized protein n=1 Tax=Trypanosoma conorhini TaxID=83891 RepID=A0A3R7RUG4_9TRYP|nr:uncharacterized protein Tco025E_06281 [Trypanosoma conorhini]RNF13216.1 hypothetical protein Tco025E_06281 [Trypanosoma conorhini]